MAGGMENQESRSWNHQYVHQQNIRFRNLPMHLLLTYFEILILLPVTHSKFSHTEMVWGYIKRKVASHNLWLTSSHVEEEKSKDIREISVGDFGQFIIQKRKRKIKNLAVVVNFNISEYNFNLIEYGTQVFYYSVLIFESTYHRNATTENERRE